MPDNYTTLAASIDSADEAGTISGVAVKYNTKIVRGEKLYELVKPGAFAAQVKDPARVQILWQHDHESPIGRATDLVDLSDGMRFEARISEHADIPEARKALALLREGLIDEVSVGFQWQTWEKTEDDEGLTISHVKARLRELSVVTFGALGREARVLSVASDAADQVHVQMIREKLRSLRA